MKSVNTLIKSNQAQVIALFLVTSVMAFAQAPGGGDPGLGLANAFYAWMIRIAFPVVGALIVWKFLHMSFSLIRGGVGLATALLAGWGALRPDQILGWIQNFGR